MIVFIEKYVDKQRLAIIVQELTMIYANVKVRLGANGFELALIGNNLDAKALQEREGVSSCLNGQAGANFLKQHYLSFQSASSFFNWGV